MNKILFLFFIVYCKIGFTQNGCTDQNALNFDNLAVSNDGSCTYAPTTVNVSTSNIIPSLLTETSSLLFWMNDIWTINDNIDSNLYKFSDFNFNDYQSYSFPNLTNVDWEEISQDSEYIYIGDFGNNFNGARTDLKIYRISKANFFNTGTNFETISFSYGQNLPPVSPNTTNYDCEAFVVTDSHIYLFTKRWADQTTSIYRILKSPGNHIAEYVSNFNSEGLVTGATLVEDKRLLMLCGYNTNLQPFIWLLYDYNGVDFFSGNRRKLNVNLPFHQVEGITLANGLDCYISNENFTTGLINIPQKIHKINLTPFLNDYLNSLSNNHYLSFSNSLFTPNPIETHIFINPNEIKHFNRLTIYSMTGSLVYSLSFIDPYLNLEFLPKGIYIMSFEGQNTKRYIIQKK